MRQFSGHVATALMRAISNLAQADALDREKPILIVESIESTDWASVTFVGEIHIFQLRITGVAASVADIFQRLVTQLPDAEIAMSGYFVAEIAVVADDEASGSDADVEPVPALAHGTSSQPVMIRALVIKD